MRSARERDFELVLWIAAALLLALGAERGPGDSREFQPRPRASGMLRVVTWNVGGGELDGGTPLSAGSVEHVIETLGLLEPDVCVLQEVADGRQASGLARGLGFARFASTGGDRRVVVLARGAVLESFPVQPPGGRALGVLLRLEAGPDVALVALHADAYSAGTRNRQVGLALEALRERSREGGRLLVGDLNLDLDLDKRRDLFTDDLHSDVETYNHVAADLEDAARGTGPTAEPDRRLDYVFADRDAFEVVAADVWRGRRAGAMDHDPVVVDLEPRR